MDCGVSVRSAPFMLKPASSDKSEPFMLEPPLTPSSPPSPASPSPASDQLEAFRLTISSSTSKLTSDSNSDNEISAFGTFFFASNLNVRNVHFYREFKRRDLNGKGLVQKYSSNVCCRELRSRAVENNEVKINRSDDFEIRI